MTSRRTRKLSSSSEDEQLDFNSIEESIVIQERVKQLLDTHDVGKTKNIFSNAEQNIPKVQVRRSIIARTLKLNTKPAIISSTPMPNQKGSNFSTECSLNISPIDSDCNDNGGNEQVKTSEQDVIAIDSSDDDATERTRKYNTRRRRKERHSPKSVEKERQSAAKVTKNDNSGTSDSKKKDIDMEQSKNLVNRTDVEPLKNNNNASMNLRSNAKAHQTTYLTPVKETSKNASPNLRSNHASASKVQQSTYLTPIKETSHVSADKSSKLESRNKTPTRIIASTSLQPKPASTEPPKTPTTRSKSRQGRLEPETSSKIPVLREKSQNSTPRSTTPQSTLVKKNRKSTQASTSKKKTPTRAVADVGTSANFGSTPDTITYLGERYTRSSSRKKLEPEQEEKKEQRLNSLISKLINKQMQTSSEKLSVPENQGSDKVGTATQTSQRDEVMENIEKEMQRIHSPTESHSESFPDDRSEILANNEHLKHKLFTSLQLDDNFDSSEDEYDVSDKTQGHVPWRFEHTSLRTPTNTFNLNFLKPSNRNSEEKLTVTRRTRQYRNLESQKKCTVPEKPALDTDFDESSDEPTLTDEFIAGIIAESPIKNSEAQENHVVETPRRTTSFVEPMKRRSISEALDTEAEKRNVSAHEPSENNSKTSRRTPSFVERMKRKSISEAFDTSSQSEKQNVSEHEPSKANGYVTAPPEENSGSQHEDNTEEPPNVPPETEAHHFSVPEPPLSNNEKSSGSRKRVVRKKSPRKISSDSGLEDDAVHHVVIPLNEDAHVSEQLETAEVELAENAPQKKRLTMRVNIARNIEPIVSNLRDSSPEDIVSRSNLLADECAREKTPTRQSESHVDADSMSLKKRLEKIPDDTVFKVPKTKASKNNRKNNPPSTQSDTDECAREKTPTRQSESHVDASCGRSSKKRSEKIPDDTVFKVPKTKASKNNRKNNPSSTQTDTATRKPSKAKKKYDDENTPVMNSSKDEPLTGLRRSTRERRPPVKKYVMDMIYVGTLKYPKESNSKRGRPKRIVEDEVLQESRDNYLRVPGASSTADFSGLHDTAPNTMDEMYLNTNKSSGGKLDKENERRRTKSKPRDLTRITSDDTTSSNVGSDHLENRVPEPDEVTTTRPEVKKTHKRKPDDPGTDFEETKRRTIDPERMQIGEIIDLTMDDEVVRWKFVENKTNFQMASDNQMISSGFQMFDGASTGYLKILPGAIKSPHTTRKHSLYYFVVKGKGIIQLHNTMSPVVELSRFGIPLGMEYSIRNESEVEELLLAYVKKPVARAQ